MGSGSTGDRLCNHKQVDQLDRKSGGLYIYAAKGIVGELYVLYFV